MFIKILQGRYREEVSIMSYVHPFSKRCDKSEVDLFRVPPTQQSLERGRWIDYAPLSSLENPNSAITFLIAGTDEYIDLSKTILTVTGKITKKDGTSKLDGNDQSNVAPVNNFLHSLFRQVDVYLNGKQVTPAMGTYAYRSYIETLLNYDVSAKQSQFSSALYYKDTAGQMDKTGALPATKTLNYRTAAGAGSSTDSSVNYYVDGTGNQGFAKRHQFIKNGNRFVLSGPIFSDIFMTDRLLLNMMDLKVVLNRSSDAFSLMEIGNTPPIDPKVQLTVLYMYLREVLSLDPPQMVESSPKKEKCNYILQMVSSLDMSTKLDLLQKFTSSIVPQVKRELDFYQSVPEEKPPYILPNPPSPLFTDPGNPPSPLFTDPGNPPSPLFTGPGNPPSPLFTDPGNPPSPMITEPGTPEHCF